MAAEYQRWIKVANDLGLGGDELRTFVKDRQEEAKIERSKIEEADTRKLEAEREARKLEADTRKLEAERESKKLELEQAERKFLAELEAKRISEEQESRRILAEQESR